MGQPDDEPTSTATSPLESGRTTRRYHAIGPVPRAPRPDRLVQVSGPGAPRNLVVNRDKIVVGRGDTAHFRIHSGHVSRSHLVVTRSGPEITFTDQDSHNGTWLNGVRVHSATLREGDTVQIGDAVFVFQRGS